jgi:glutathione S-transferase
MRIFHREYAGRPIRVAWMLEELGEPYELTTMTWEEGKGAEHLARHPLGRVPVLEDSEGPLFESVAICLHLADMHPEAGLIPPPGTHERALVYQWSCFAPAELEPPLIEAAIQAERDPERAAKALARFEAGTGALSSALDGKDYLVGERFTVADVLIGTTVGFTKRTGHELPADLQEYCERLTERPAYQRAFERTAG